jgi:hypothetical protein
LGNTKKNAKVKDMKQKNIYKHIAVTKQVHETAKQKADKKGMFLHRYIEYIINKDE